VRSAGQRRGGVTGPVTAALMPSQGSTP
jgi:hypothetical protein